MNEYYLLILRNFEFEKQNNNVTFQIIVINLKYCKIKKLKWIEDKRTMIYNSYKLLNIFSQSSISWFLNNKQFVKYESI